MILAICIKSFDVKTITFRISVEVKLLKIPFIIQVRIVLNKADEITAEELLKIEGNLVWNVSPLMSSLEPPALYAGSFWSQPYKEGSPKKLLKAQEISLLKDIRDAIDKRVVNRIATARRFAVCSIFRQLCRFFMLTVNSG